MDVGAEHRELVQLLKTMGLLSVRSRNVHRASHPRWPLGWAVTCCMSASLTHRLQPQPLVWWRWGSSGR